jgi:hypothetical protein
MAMQVREVKVNESRIHHGIVRNPHDFFATP